MQRKESSLTRFLSLAVGAFYAALVAYLVISIVRDIQKDLAKQRSKRPSLLLRLARLLVRRRRSPTAISKGLS